MDAQLRDRWLATAHERLAAAGLRTGAARERVMECLARDAQCLVSVQELMDRLRRDGGGGSQASLYRILDELHGLGLLHRHVLPDGTSRYELALPGTRHHHFVDEASGRVEPFTDPDLERAIATAARRLGLRMTGHEVVITGRRAVTDGRDQGSSADAP